MANVKITVLKKLKTDEVFSEHAVDTMEPECARIGEIGKEYITSMDMPEGFCSWAWADIQRDVIHLALGGDFPWMKQKGTIISACTDGLRPVLFKIERIED
jgi:uncharacterized repeat protein (TIGR04076 family)